MCIIISFIYENILFIGVRIKYIFFNVLSFFFILKIFFKGLIVFFFVVFMMFIMLIIGILLCIFFCRIFFSFEFIKNIVFVFIEDFGVIIC